MRQHGHAHVAIPFALASLALIGSAGMVNDEGSSAGVGIVIYDNISDGGGLNAQGASPASQLDITLPFDAGAVDDFVLPESPQCVWSVTGVQWTGVYWNGSAPGSMAGIRVIIWPDTPDGPDGRGPLTPDIDKALAVYQITGNGGEIPSASGIANAYDYAVQLPEPYLAIPGVRYWIQIQALLPYPPQWGIHVTQTRSGLGPMEYFDLLGLPAWVPISDTGDLAFKLIGEARTIDCDDGNACTTDTCKAGTCIHTAVTCDDGSACTEDTCDSAAGCTFTAISCDDGNACTNDSCDPSGGCVYETVTCDDSNACTTDSCEPATGCQHSAATCDDGNACTEDTCDPVSGCQTATITCDDGDACTDDTCDPETGCTTTAINCDDGSACTEDSCDPSTGCAYAPIGCDDENACTSDSCHPEVGCIHESITCDDGDLCSIDSCDPIAGCVAEPIDCDDGDLCTIDSCLDGVCGHNGPPDMDGDGDVDLDDFNIFFNCIETKEKQQAPECRCTDLNGDGVVNMYDYGMLQSAFNGAK